MAKLPDNGMVQCNMCATTFLYRVVVAQMFAGTKKVPATLRWRRVKGSTKDGMVQ